MEAVSQYGVPAIVALMIIKEVFGFVKTRNGKGPLRGFEVYHAKQLSDLYNWHKPDPETGRFRWYERDDEIILALRKNGNEIVHEIRELRKAYVKNGKR